MAHAQLATGDLEEARRWAALAREGAAHIDDPEDREIIEGQIASLLLGP